jgi:site-specific recombinase XerD
MNGFVEGHQRGRNKASLVKSVRRNLLRHAFATHNLEDGQDISTLQELLEYCDVNTTMIYIHNAEP